MISAKVDRTGTNVNWRASPVWRFRSRIARVEIAKFVQIGAGKVIIPKKLHRLGVPERLIFKGARLPGEMKIVLT